MEDSNIRFVKDVINGDLNGMYYEENLGQWFYNIIKLSYQDLPFTHKCTVEKVDNERNYIGISLGIFTSEQNALNTIAEDWKTRLTDKRTAREMDEEKGHRMFENYKKYKPNF